MGLLLLQKHCTCPTEKTLVRCPVRWRTVFAGSRFCTGVERSYAPIEGKAAAIAWALEKCSIFIMGCPNLIEVTDHQSLTGIFGNRDHSKIHNPYLFKLEEKSLRYYFTIQHYPGKWHKGVDAISLNPVATVEAFLSLSPTHPSSKDVIHTIMNSGNSNTAMSSNHICASERNDQSYLTDKCNQPGISFQTLSHRT